MVDRPRYADYLDGTEPDPAHFEAQKLLMGEQSGDDDRGTVFIAPVDADADLILDPEPGEYRDL